LSGKAVAAQNARKHGLFGRDVVHTHEDSTEFDALVADLRSSMAPASALEDELIDQLAMAFWRNRRLAKAERFELNGGTTDDQAVETGVRRSAGTSVSYPDARDRTNFTIRRMVLFGRYQAMITLEIRRTLQMFYDAQERRMHAIEAVANDVAESDETE
jgi:hypothetical protein